MFDSIDKQSINATVGKYIGQISVSLPKLLKAIKPILLPFVNISPRL